MSKFHIISSSSSSDAGFDDDDVTTLPFPQPLSRAAFTSPSAFSPTNFLSSLHNRHQSLEDLRLELRNRSKELERELVELVNRDYVDFLGLGSSLSGGEGKVEDLRVGLLQVRREVGVLAAKLEGVLGQIERGLKEREDVRRRRNLIRTLLSISHRLTTLEISLLLSTPVPTNASNSCISTVATAALDLTSSATEEYLYLSSSSSSPIASLARLTSLKTSYLILLHLHSKIPKRDGGNSPNDHPFLVSQKSRIDRIRKTLLLDLSSALKEAIRVSTGEFGAQLSGGGGEGEPTSTSTYINLPLSEGKKLLEINKAKQKIVKIMEIFEEIGEGPEAIKVFKEVGRSSAGENKGETGERNNNSVPMSKAKIALMSNIGITQQPGAQRMEMKK